MGSLLSLVVPMKALAYEEPNKITLTSKPEPALQAPGGAVVRVTLATICGTDLRITKGDILTCEPRRASDREGVGVMESVDTTVTLL